MLRSLLLIFCLTSAPAFADGLGFRTPSGNIYCNGQLESPLISCVIVERQGPAPQPRPASCAGQWGHIFTIEEAGPVRMECTDWTLRPSTYTDIAQYGVSGTFGQISCPSEATGFSCSNASGHGFFLSRRTQGVY